MTALGDVHPSLLVDASEIIGDEPAFELASAEVAGNVAVADAAGEIG
jgi:hypothetical protein